uniref:nuclease-related domain-containing protein n=1 Tax=Klebsiella pneumoniae TaxID=573 RepID=UPI003D815E2E
MLSTIFLVFVMLILSCIILCIWPLISNMFSEQRTRNALKAVLADLEGTLISDITLPLNASQTTQIDHIFISTKGIFIIEEKNYTGDIYGGLDDKIWTVVYGFGKAKHKMLNPFVQNKTHISGVCRAIKRGDEGIVNVVLLTGSSKFMVDPAPEWLCRNCDDLGNKFTAYDAESGHHFHFNVRLPNITKLKYNHCYTPLSNITNSTDLNSILSKSSCIRGLFRGLFVFNEN